MKKRLLSVLLALVMLVSLLSMAVFAEGEIDTWDATADTSWYNETDTEFHLTTAEQLAGLAALVNADNRFAGKTVYLESDLDLGGHEWWAIGVGGDTAKYWGGVFDGQHHKIFHLTSKLAPENTKEVGYHGLFGVISSGGVVKNVNVMDADLYSDDDSLRMGILADWVNDGVVENCYTSGMLHNTSGAKVIGGLIGDCTAGTQVLCCASDACIISDYCEGVDPDGVGGLIGVYEFSSGTPVIRDCWFGGSIVCDRADLVGGILGVNLDFDDGNYPELPITNCFVVTRDILNNGAEGKTGLVSWLAIIAKGNVTNCFWPDRPATTLEPNSDCPSGGYDDDNYFSALRADQAGEVTPLGTSSCGKEVSDFTDPAILESLQRNASEGVTWVAGAKHPIFDWQADLFPTEPEEPEHPERPITPALPGFVFAGAGSQMQHFVDVTSMDYYFDAVNWAYEHGITGGTGKVTFSPDAPCTRAQAVTFLWRAMGSPRAEKATTFTDVKENAYYADAVAWAVENGITKGTSATTFSPDAPCTRAQIVTMLYRAIGVESTVDAGFVDVSASAYYADAVDWATQYKITGGTGANRFSPDATCTRGQIVTFLYRAK